MGQLIGNTPKHKALEPSHASVPDYHEVCLAGLADRDQRVGRITLGAVHFSGHTLACGLSEHLSTDVVSAIEHHVGFSHSNSSEVIR